MKDLQLYALHIIIIKNDTDENKWGTSLFVNPVEETILLIITQEYVKRNKEA